jgi:glycine/D-amino acid oxidase-like deaminating enzyme
MPRRELRLAELGYRDVLLVDRDQLTSGSTFHSAGLVGQLRGSVVPRREAPSQSHSVVGFA